MSATRQVTDTRHSSRVPAQTSPARTLAMAWKQRFRAFSFSTTPWHMTYSCCGSRVAHPSQDQDACFPCSLQKGGILQPHSPHLNPDRDNDVGFCTGSKAPARRTRKPLLHDGDSRLNFSSSIRKASTARIPWSSINEDTDDWGGIDMRCLRLPVVNNDHRTTVLWPLDHARVHPGRGTLR